MAKFLKHSILFLLLLSASIGFSQQERSYIREGNKMFNDSNYVAADSLYLKALQIDSTSFEAKYNLVNSQLKQGKNDISIKGLNELTESTEDKLLKSKIFHNLGNAHTNKKEWDKAVNAYRNALRNNPNDKDTRYNYAYAKGKLAQENQQKKDNKDDNKDQDKQDQKDKDKKDKGDKNKKNDKDQKGEGDQDKKDKDGEDKKKEDEQKKKDEEKKKEGDKKDGDKENAEDKDNKDQNGKENKKPQTEQEKKDSEQKAKAKEVKRKQAEQILRQLDKNEKSLQQKMIRAKMKKQTRKKIDKDW